MKVEIPTSIENGRSSIDTHANVNKPTFKQGLTETMHLFKTKILCISFATCPSESTVYKNYLVFITQ